MKIAAGRGGSSRGVRARRGRLFLEVGTFHYFC